MRYIKQTNGGKHRAVNRGVREAQGSLFFIVDSDDYLCKDAIEVITNEYKEIEHDKDYCGVCGLRVDNKGEKVGGILKKLTRTSWTSDISINSKATWLKSCVPM